MAERGLQPVSGTFCHPLEVLQPPATEIARKTVKATSAGSILIFHDGYNARGANRAATVAAVAMVIDRLRDDGYGFATIDMLQRIPG